MVAIQIGIIVFLVLVLAIIMQDEYRRRKLERKKARTHRFWTNGPGSDRRKSIRIDTDIDVLYEVMYGNQSQRRPSLAKNISAGGVNLALDEKLLPDTVLNLELNIPESSHPIPARGKIIWVKEIADRFIAEKQERYFSTGIKFVDMSHDDQATLNEFINRHIKRPAE